MSKDFIKLVFLGLLIALPVAGYLMHTWLSDYAYHIDLSWWLFLIPVVVVISITILVVSLDIIKTAVANPVEKLRAD